MAVDFVLWVGFIYLLQAMHLTVFFSFLSSLDCACMFVFSCLNIYIFVILKVILLCCQSCHRIKSSSSNNSLWLLFLGPIRYWILTNVSFFSHLKFLKFMHWIEFIAAIGVNSFYFVCFVSWDFSLSCKIRILCSSFSLCFMFYRINSCMFSYSPLRKKNAILLL